MHVYVLDVISLSCVIDWLVTEAEKGQPELSLCDQRVFMVY